MDEHQTLFISFAVFVSVNAQHVQICDFVAKSAYTKFMDTTNRF